MNVPAVNFQLDPTHNEWPKEREADRRECDRFLQEEQWRDAHNEYRIIRAMYAGAVKLDDIARESGVPRTTTHRTLKRLMESNVVRRYKGKHQGEADKYRWVG